MEQTINLELKEGILLITGSENLTPETAAALIQWLQENYNPLPK